MKSERFLVVALVLSMCIWGISWSSSKVLSAYGSSESLTFIRFGIVATGMPLFLLALKIDMRVSKKGWGHLIAAALLMTIYSQFFFKGLQLGQAGAAGVLVTSLNPIFAYIIGLVISKSIPGRREIIGLFLGLTAGLVLLEIWADDHEVFDAGNAFFVMAAFVWGAMSKFTSHANKFGNVFGFALWIQVLTFIGISFVTDFEEVSTIVQTADFKFWGNMLYLGLINTMFATSCFFYAANKMGAERASSYVYIVPGAAVIASWLIMDETILIHTICGGLLGVLAVVIINGKRKAKTSD